MPTQDNTSPESSSASTTSISYEGESTMYVYESVKLQNTERVQSIRLDISFTVKNGEPIIGTAERYNEIRSLLTPLGPTYGDGYYYIYFLYYDMNCTQEVGFSDIATKDTDLFYFIRG